MAGISAHHLFSFVNITSFNLLGESQQTFLDLNRDFDASAVLFDLASFLFPSIFYFFLRSEISELRSDFELEQQRADEKA